MQEALHSSKESGERGMVIKLDMVNGFDIVRHDFIFEILENFGFDHWFITWIKACTKSP